MLHEFAARGSIARTAEALGYTPSAVSQQLAVLEREAGTPLLDRTARSAGLTAAGRRLAVHAFPKAGTYELTLRITDSWGNWAYATRPITITRTRGAPRR